MRKISHIFIVFILTFILNNSTFAFDSLLFKPLTANHLESRIGFFYQHTDEKVRLDIGHSLDLMHILTTDITTNSKLNMRLGGDFFILSRLRSEGKMKFPVETSDFYFGLNCTGAFSAIDPVDTTFSILNRLAYRLRVAHISSHLVDGYTKNNVFIQEPFVYSREFIDLVLSYNTDFIRPYIGVTAIFSTIPKDVRKFVPQIGFDFDYPVFFRNSLHTISLAGGYDFKLNNNAAISTGCNAAQVGLLCKLSKNVGVSLNYYYYRGYSIHGMFYNVKENYNGVGVQVHY